MINYSIIKKCLSVRLFCLLLLMFSATIVFSQKRTISGNVVDEIKEPLIGVTVQVKGTTQGTVTDLDGNYSILVDNPNVTLIFSYVGYKKEIIPLKNRTVVNVTMQMDSEVLDDVVVVGYGTQKRLSVTGSVSSVKATDLARTSATTTAAALAGKVPGITNRQTSGEPGVAMRMEIRNLGTPLYVIDGVMKDEGQFNNLDVNDIESISILKDGSAAIYGVKAANGVVLVTTKRGTVNEKPTVTINGYYGLQKWTRFPELSNAYQYKRAVAEADVIKNGVTPNLISREDLEKYRTEYYNPETGEDYRSFDWYDFAVRDNTPQKYLSVSSQGGGEKTNYYLSISRIDQDAAFKDFNFNRTNIQLNLDTKIGKYLKVSASMNGRIETRESPAITMDENNCYKNDFWYLRWGISRNLPTERPYANDNPNYINKIMNVQNNHAYADRDIVGYGDDVWRVFQGNWDIEWNTPIKGLKAQFLYSYYIANNQEERSRKSVPVYTYNRNMDSYEQDGTLADGSGWLERYLRKRQRTIEENMYRFTVNYDNKFGEHAVSAVLVGEATERFDRSMLMVNNAIASNDQTLFFDKDENNVIRNEGYSVRPSAGFIGRINYNYADRYLLELSGRYDGSFIFPRNKRWGFFPSDSAGWRVSSEQFFANSVLSNYISNLKFRVSYGEMGNDDNYSSNKVLGIGDWDYMYGYNMNAGTGVIASDPFISSSGSTIGSVSQRGMPVTNLSWVKSSMLNIGVDLGFLNNRLTLEVDGFMRKRSGLTDRRGDVYIPYETGYSEMPLENLNTDKHIGIDGLIKWQDNVGREFYYSVGFNATLARKKNGNVYGERFGNSWEQYRKSGQNRWSYVNWGYEVIGRFQTQEEIDAYPVIMNISNGSDRNKLVLPGDLIYKDQNGDGVINDYDSRPIGYAEGGLPYMTYGLNLACSYKGFDIAIDFAGAALQSFQRNWETKWPFQAGNTFNYMVEDRWHHEDPLDPSTPWVSGNYPALRPQSVNAWHVYCNNSTYWLTNAAYFRMKNLEIGYTIPQKITQKIAMQKFRVFFNGTNLFSIDNTSKFGLDPENSDTNGLGYPMVRVLTFGATITF